MTNKDEQFGISSFEGSYDILRGDYIIRGIQGEVHLCESDIFEDTYEEFEER